MPGQPITTTPIISKARGKCIVLVGTAAGIRRSATAFFDDDAARQLSTASSTIATYRGTGDLPANPTGDERLAGEQPRVRSSRDGDGSRSSDCRRSRMVCGRRSRVSGCSWNSSNTVDYGVVRRAGSWTSSSLANNLDRAGASGSSVSIPSVPSRDTTVLTLGRLSDRRSGARPTYPE